MELSWRERGKLWIRMGVRLLITLIGLAALIRIGPWILSLFAPFLLAFGVAWILAPVVRWLHETLHWNRKFGTLLLLLLVFVGAGALLCTLLYRTALEILSLAGSWAELVRTFQNTMDTIGNSLSQITDLLPAGAQDLFDSLLLQLYKWLETVLPNLLSAAADVVTNVAKGLPSFAVAAFVFLLASYFITADYPRLRSMLTDRLPEGPRRFLSHVKRAVSAGFGGYIKAQAILSIGVFFILLVGFLIIHQPYAILLALLLAILDFIPIFGSGTVLVPWSVIDLFSGQMHQTIALMIIWGLVSLFRSLAEPKVLGNQTGLSPILSLVSVYVGMQIGGVLGMILGPVFCLVVRNILQAGVFDRTIRDCRMAFADLCALLSGGSEQGENSKTI